MQAPSRPRRHESTNATAFPSLDPPILTRLPQNTPHPRPSNLPASGRYRGNQLPTHQDAIERLDWEEEAWFQSLHDTRSFGFSWLVPLGRQNTQEEDVESSFDSPRGGGTPLADVDGVDQTMEDGEEGDEGGAGGGGRDLDAEVEDADGSASGDDEEDDEEEELEPGSEPEGENESSVRMDSEDVDRGPWMEGR